VTGLVPATAAAKKEDLHTAVRYFGTAVLGRATYTALSTDRLDQARINSSKAEFLSETFMLPLDPAAVARCSVPTLLTVADSSPRIWPLLAQCLHELMPNSQIEQIPDASHIMHEDNKQHFNSVVGSFLKLQEHID